ncbi:MAG: DUF4251 domain-containing protein [Bacteroidales bacterium]|jgi:hypothetical protein|nr:DUF4251 domain-containing protein [Bacteroidales bacterium]
MKKLGILVLLLVAVNGAMYAQEKKSKKERRQEQAEKVQEMVKAQDYRFVAQRALPMSGRSVNLTSEYDVTVGKDTVNAYLPYFGRAYVAPMYPSEGGIKFESKDFDYKLENAKKGGWNVYITIKDTNRRIGMILNISTSGSANLSVNDDSRQSISFNGYVDERKKK